ncbi:MAG: CoA-acylating methylmalonate-semialdehyde dehydrogenase [Deltaproteobacteria bacterium]|nr:CoA-acylating methylmalonate-semialdehyde dehydrogenase [Deltaproteobacteria bacterium]
MTKFTATSNDFTEHPEARNYIGGEWVDPTGSQTLDVLNPRFGKAMSKVRLGSAADVDAAVKAGAKAQKEWGSWPMRERAEVFYKARELMFAHLDELSWLCTHENGKTFAESKAEVLRGIECMDLGCSLPNWANGERQLVSRGVVCETHYEPLGVVAGITPFNFPFMVPLWMMPQALVGGNAFVLKPSEQVPLSAVRQAELFTEAGLPKGVLNLVQGGQEVVEAIADHPGIKAVGFVGSTKVARLVYARSAANGKRANCLGGAKNHLIVVPDADLNVSADNIVASFSGCAGQRCMAAAVLVAVGDVQHIIDAIVERAGKIRTGEDMGPIITEGAAKKIRGYIDGAEKAGAKVLLDGRGVNPVEGGNWVGPTILDGVTPEMPAGCEEIFGPVLSIMRVKNLDEALAIENGNPYGNASCIYTQSGDVAQRVVARMEAGMCGVNIGVPVPRDPYGFGGWNDSAFGPGNMSGWDGFRFWTRQRKVTTKWALQTDQTWTS